MENQNGDASQLVNYVGSCETDSINTMADSFVETEDSSSDVELKLEKTSGSFSFRKLSSKHKCIIMSICSTSFIIMCSESIMAPLYPAEAAKRGISSQVSGWVFAAYAMGQVLFSPLLGKFLSKIGSKFVYLAGVFFAGGCTLLFGILEFIPPSDGALVFVCLCFLMQIVLSVGVASQQTAAFAIAAKEFQYHITTVFGVTEVFVGIGMTIGPAAGGVLSSIGGFHLPFVIIGVLIIGSLPFNYWLIPKIQDKTVASSKKNRKSMWRILKNPAALVMCAAIMLGAATWAVLDPILELRLSEAGLKPETIGVVFLLISASYALFCPVSGWIADKLHDNRLLMIPGFLLCALSHSLLGPCPLFGLENNELWLTIIALIMLGVAVSMTVIPSYEIVLRTAIESGMEDDLDTHGAVAGIWCSMYALGDFFGPIYGGWIVDTAGFALGLTYTALACVFMVILLAVEAVYERKCQCRTSGDSEEKETLLNKDVKQYYETVTFINEYSKLMWDRSQFP